MPRGFSDKEKNLIKEALIEKGRLLFTAFGLKKTSIADLSKVAGIAQGSFYSFYNSKEELYFEIMKIEESTMKEKLLSELTPFENHPREYLKHLLRRSLKMVEDYPLMTQMYQENTMEILVRKLPDDMLERHFKKDQADFLPLIESWRTHGMLRSEKSETIISLLRSLLILPLHKKEIGETVYSDTMELLINLIAEGLGLEERK